MSFLITLMTDFGLSDPYVGVMKGVILGIAPEARLVDLTHLIAPQNIHEAAVALYRAAPYFPADTIHIVVVDPGVGTCRRPLAAQIGTQRYVGPDNGTLTLLLARAIREGRPTQFVHLNQPRYWRAEISNVFHGRDIFAPVAAHWATGVPLSDLGSPITDPVRLPITSVEHTPEGLRGTIIHVDHFGNIGVNIRAEDIAGPDGVTVRVKGAEIHGLVRTFGERSPGELIAYINSAGELAISVVNGNAGQRLGAQVGDEVAVVRVE